MDAARRVVTALSHAPGVDAKVRSAIAGLQSASGSHRDLVKAGQAYAAGDSDVFNRAWRWLAAVTERANAEGQHDIAAMAYMFVWWWSNTMEPTLNGADHMNLCLDPIPADARATIFREGQAAARALPPTYVVATSSDREAITAQALCALP